jgi:SAM-dependent methyltransferase
VSAEQQLFRNRARADAFGSAAAEYDRFRPTYPVELIDDLVQLGGTDVLDIGCGTGIASRLLSARGLAVIGVEPDARMAEVAQAQGNTVEVATIESWDDAGRTFDLVTAAQSWHWMDPAVAVPKVARVLRPGGWVALFWNHDTLRQPAEDRIDEVYRRVAPELNAYIFRGGMSHKDQPYPTPFRESAAFASVSTKRYTTTREDTAEHWLRMVATHSDHMLLAPQKQAELRAATAAAIESLGGRLVSDVDTYLILARRV